MTETFADSIVGQERQNATRTADLLAVDALRRAGLEDVTPEHLDLIAKQEPAVGELRALHTHYSTGVNAIVDHPEASQDDRLDGYAELHADVSHRYEETSQQVASQLRDARRKLNEAAFGVPGLGTANGPGGSTPPPPPEPPGTPVEGGTVEEIDDTDFAFVHAVALAAAVEAGVKPDRARDFLRLVPLQEIQRGDDEGVRAAVRQTLEHYSEFRVLSGPGRAPGR